MYRQRINLSEKEVNEILNEGYILHSITPVYHQNKENLGAEGRTTLYYHFVKDNDVISYDDNIVIMSKDSLMMRDINGNDLGTI